MPKGAKSTSRKTFFNDIRLYTYYLTHIKYIYPYLILKSYDLPASSPTWSMLTTRILRCPTCGHADLTELQISLEISLSGTQVTQATQATQATHNVSRTTENGATPPPSLHHTAVPKPSRPCNKCDDFNALLVGRSEISTHRHGKTWKNMERHGAWQVRRQLVRHLTSVLMPFACIC